MRPFPFQIRHYPRRLRKSAEGLPDARSILHAQSTRLDGVARANAQTEGIHAEPTQIGDYKADRRYGSVARPGFREGGRGVFEHIGHEIGTKHFLETAIQSGDPYAGLRSGMLYRANFAPADEDFYGASGTASQVGYPAFANVLGAFGEHDPIHQNGKMVGRDSMYGGLGVTPKWSGRAHVDAGEQNQFAQQYGDNFDPYGPEASAAFPRPRTDLFEAWLRHIPAMQRNMDFSGGRHVYMGSIIPFPNGQTHSDPAWFTSRNLGTSMYVSDRPHIAAGYAGLMSDAPDAVAPGKMYQYTMSNDTKIFDPTETFAHDHPLVHYLDNYLKEFKQAVGLGHLGMHNPMSPQVLASQGKSHVSGQELLYNFNQSVNALYAGARSPESVARLVQAAAGVESPAQRRIKLREKQREWLNSGYSVLGPEYREKGYSELTDENGYFDHDGDAYDGMMPDPMGSGDRDTSGHLRTTKSPDARRKEEAGETVFPHLAYIPARSLIPTKEYFSRMMSLLDSPAAKRGAILPIDFDYTDLRHRSEDKQGDHPYGFHKHLFSSNQAQNPNPRADVVDTENFWNDESAKEQDRGFLADEFRQNQAEALASGKAARNPTLGTSQEWEVAPNPRDFLNWSRELRSGTAGNSIFSAALMGFGYDGQAANVSDYAMVPSGNQFETSIFPSSMHKLRFEGDVSGRPFEVFRPDDFSPETLKKLAETVIPEEADDGVRVHSSGSINPTVFRALLIQLGQNRLQSAQGAVTPIRLGRSSATSDWWQTRNDWEIHQGGGTLRNLLWRLRGEDSRTNRPQSPRLDLTDPNHIQQLLDFSGSSYNQRWLKWARENVGASIHDPSNPFPGYAPSGGAEYDTTPEYEEWYRNNPGRNIYENPFLGPGTVSSSVKYHEPRGQTHADGLALLGLLQRLNPNSSVPLQGALRDKAIGAFLRRVRQHRDYQRRVPVTGGDMLPISKALVFRQLRRL